ncbi:adenine nucleotide alpha hydrolases-like protein [Neolentinus lepideus HHB14362 ss-1]|uniref:Adenine nucleotide alpha hydrolases-like protein n=1 Tax=Neolentinus lepideus HHB14362 ss-1 TaxID=1314782 RepID=A0A165R7N5_9AGAM|nr:adenine nucleotide alpha hydrolases-like protein [Neolentinus lepideus HHB14362 ss-1]
MSLSSMMGGLSALSFSRSSTDDSERGRSFQTNKGKDKVRSSSLSASVSQDDITDSESNSRARSQSPFRLRRTRARDPSPAVCALTQSDVESDTESTRRSIRLRTAFVGSPTSDDESGSETEGDNDSDDSWADEDHFDFETERNTERNALVPAERVDAAQEEYADPLGEGVNVVVPPEPYFPTTLNASHSKRKNSKRHHDLLPLDQSRPIFQRDRCTITITHGNPARALEENGRRPRRYVVASDLSEESRYAVEWGIGTVLRDGDEMLLVTVVENENKVDPPTMNAMDRAIKLRNQQERQALAYILVRQVTGLLQRTRLNVTVACQSWHAKNHRHMLLDIVDYFQPTMVIVGSRGLGQLKGILLGSTSHYLIQKCSVPVMVARRRLKRPPRKNAHLAPHRARVSLAQAGIDRVAPKVDHDVQVMRDEIERDDETRDGVAEEQNEEDLETEMEADTLPGRKVAGE